jgi:hypothetical protein
MRALSCVIFSGQGRRIDPCCPITGLNFVHGNLHMTFASVTADHSANRASSKRIVSARIVMPIIGAIELRDLLTQLIDALTEQGVITSEAPLPTIVTPPGRPH